SEEIRSCHERFELLRHAEASCPTCDGSLPRERRLELGRHVKEQLAELEAARERESKAAGEAARASERTRRRGQDRAGRAGPAAGADRRLRAAELHAKETAVAEDRAALGAAEKELEGSEAVEAKAARLQEELAAAAGQHTALSRDLGSAQAALARC